MTRVALLSVLLCVGIVPAGFVASQASPVPAATPSAIVAGLSGQASVRANGDTARALRLFDRLEVGATVETGDDGDVVLVFRGGERARIGGGSRGRVEATHLTPLHGTVTPLAAVSPVPIVAPVRAAGTTITAVRIRAGGIAVRGPAHGVTTLPDHTVLHFDPVAAAARYEVEIEAPDATVVYRAESDASPVAVPAGVLQPGRDYRWLVRTRSATGFALSGEGRFTTLAREAGAARERLRASLGTMDGAVALLAEVDWTLGLWPEALDGFRSAGATDAVIADRIAAIERRLAGRSASPHER